MSVNGITGTTAAYGTYAATTAPVVKADTLSQSTETAFSESSGVIYEPADKVATTSSTKKYTPNTELIAKLKADAEARSAQFQSLVEQMLAKQGKTFQNAGDIYSILASGNFTVDPATKAQAQADIAEDGYWGVKQTSQRILDFANALTGGDPDKIEEMRNAFLKGYKQAEKTWGGKLPDISQKTYAAVLEGFDRMEEDAGLAASKTEA